LAYCQEYDLMKLVAPSKDFQESYLAYIAELGDEERYPFPLDFDHDDFNLLLDKLKDFANGVNLPEGYVPSSTLWLVDQGELVGVTNIRHFLNDNIMHCGGHIGLGIRPSYRGKGLGSLLMKLSIVYIRNMGINEIHIHCYKNNLASSKAITANGGQLKSELQLDDGTVQRYLVS